MAGKDPDDVSAAADLAVEAFLRIVGPDLPPDRLGEGGEGQDVGLAASMRAATWGRSAEDGQPVAAGRAARRGRQA